MKNWSLRTKTLLFVEMIVLMGIVIGTYLHISQLRNTYLVAIEWQAEALAQTLVFHASEMYTHKLTLDEMAHLLILRSVELYETHNVGNLTHVAIIGKKRTYVVHHESAMRDTPVEHAGILKALDTDESEIVLVDETYHALLPLRMPQDNMVLGTIDIGVSKHVVDAAVRASHYYVTGAVVGILLFVFSGIYVFFQHIFIKPLDSLLVLGEQLAAGNLPQKTQLTQRSDEIGRLEAVFWGIAEYLRQISTVASHVSEGVLDRDVQIRSEHDLLGQSVQQMVGYLRNIAGVATRVADGNLADTADVRSTDDMFGRILQSMTEGLRTLILQIRISAEEIAGTGRGITDRIHHNTGIIEQVHTFAEGVMTTMRQMGASVEEVDNNMETLSSSVEETSTAISEMSSSITHIASNASELSEQTRHTITSLDHTLLSLESIVENMETSKQYSQDTMQDAHDGQEAVEQVVSSMETIQETVTTAVDAITVFEQRSKEIDTILAVIREITDRTGLLALNASIIAAQAGEHGRGFAVVADEIRNLADGVGTSTKDIAEIVQSLQQDTRRVVQAIHEGVSDVGQGIERTHQAQTVLQKISRSTQQSSDLVANITETLHTLMISSQDVSEAMAKVHVMTDEITAATTEQDASTRQIHVAIGHVNDMASQIRRATTEQTDGVHHVLDEVTNVSDLIDRSLENSRDIQHITKDLSSQASLLLHSVDRFKLPELETPVFDASL